MQKTTTIIIFYAGLIMAAASLFAALHYSQQSPAPFFVLSLVSWLISYFARKVQEEGSGFEQWPDNDIF